MPDTPETAATAEKFGAWLGSKKFQVVSDAQQHPTRRAPLCADCKHVEKAVGTLWRCNHPSAPVNIVSGHSTLTCERARSDDPRHTEAICRSSGSCFEPVAPAATA